MMQAKQLGRIWYELFSQYAGDLYPGLYPLKRCFALAEMAIEIKRVAQAGNGLGVRGNGHAAAQPTHRLRRDRPDRVTEDLARLEEQPVGDCSTPTAVSALSPNRGSGIFGAIPDVAVPKRLGFHAKPHPTSSAVRFDSS